MQLYSVERKVSQPIEGHAAAFAQFKMPYHGDVFRLSELADLISTYGLPDEDDPENQTYGNRIIEAQVWDLSPLVKYVS